MILVTGANGQVGWEIARRSAGVRALGRGELDITDGGEVRSVIESARPSVVVNAAAYTAVDKAESERTLAFAVNEAGPRNLATTCAAFDIPLIHISTDYVMTARSPAPIPRTTPSRRSASMARASSPENRRFARPKPAPSSYAPPGFTASMATTSSRPCCASAPNGRFCELSMTSADAPPPPQISRMPFSPWR